MTLMGIPIMFEASSSVLDPGCHSVPSHVCLRPLKVVESESLCMLGSIYQTADETWNEVSPEA